MENEYLQVRLVLGWLLYASWADSLFILIILSKPIPAQLFQPPNRPISLSARGNRSGTRRVRSKPQGSSEAEFLKIYRPILDCSIGQSWTVAPTNRSLTVAPFSQFPTVTPVFYCTFPFLLLLTPILLVTKSGFNTNKSVSLLKLDFLPRVPVPRSLPSWCEVGTPIELIESTKSIQNSMTSSVPYPLAMLPSGWATLRT